MVNNMKRLLDILSEEVKNNILSENFLFPVGSDKFNIGYDEATLGRDKILNRRDAIHNSDYGSGDERHRKRGGHKGIDIFSPKGTPLVACVNGVVSKIRKNHRVGGNTITIQDKNGINYYYAHMDRLNPELKKGDIISKGEFVGTVGDSGNAKGTHPHLHFSIYDSRGYNRGNIDPWPLLSRSIGGVKTMDKLPPALIGGIVSGDNKDFNIKDIETIAGKSVTIQDIIDSDSNEELISRGEIGDNVEEVQRILINLGYDLGEFGPNKDGIDGRFGPVTKEAVKKFQKDNNLQVDGIIGIETASELAKYL